MVDASILIPCKNAGKNFEKTLAALSRQKSVSFEIIAVDSGSSDSTVSLAKKHGARIFKIAPSDYGHGKTRNYAASKAKGRFLVFLTQDAIPVNDRWLSRLLSAYSNPQVVASYGRQTAFSDASPFEKFFYSYCYPASSSVWPDSKPSQETVIFSNANSSIRASAFEKQRFSTDKLVSEDYDWAYRALAKGGKIAYVPAAEVLHSHEHGLADMFRRYFDIGYSYSRIYSGFQSGSFAVKGLHFVLSELSFLASSGNFLLLPYAVVRESAKGLGLFLGKNHSLLPLSLKLAFTSHKRLLLDAEKQSGGKK